MSNPNEARRTSAQIYFRGVDISEDIRPYFLSATYTESEEDETDDLQIKLQDRNAIWLEHWLGDMIDAAASKSSGAEGSEEGGGALAAYKVTARSGLNVRSGPSTAYSIIGGLVSGAEVQVHSVENNWARIEYGGQEAYACASYLQKVSDGSKDTAASGTDTRFKLRAIFVQENWRGDGKDTLLDCGYFSLDSVKISGPPSVIALKAAAVSYKDSIRQTEKSRVWEEFTLSGIAGDIASENGMALLFLPNNDPYYKRVEQFKTSDTQFLSGLCHEAGIAVKITSNLIILYDQAEFEKNDSVLTVSRGDGSYIKWDLSAGQASEEYDSCRVSYTDPATGKCIEGVARVEDYDPEAEENRQLEITAKVSSEAEAMALAEKSLRLHNKFSKTVSLTFPGNPNLMSGLTMELKNWGAFNGKYAIKKTVHTIGNSGYTTKVELRKILEG